MMLGVIIMIHPLQTGLLLPNGCHLNLGYAILDFHHVRKTLKFGVKINQNQQKNSKMTVKL